VPETGTFTGEGLESELLALATRLAADEGLEVVDLRLRRAGRRWTLRLDVDRAGVPGVNIDDCQRLSRAIDAVLEERDSIPGSYTLEVSSPGIDRPIRTADDVRRNTGRKVVVEATDPEGVRREFAGTLLGLEDGDLRLEEDTTGSEVRVAVETVTRAHQQLPF
jgi:ribosome maturation factor RimP